MITRIISAIIALAIFIPILLVGGTLYNLFIYVIAIIGITEFMNIKHVKKEIPIFIRFITYIMITMLMFLTVDSSNIIYAIDYRVLATLFLAYLLPVVLYHNNETYSISDAFYLLGGVMFLGMSFVLFIVLRGIGLEFLVFLLLITIITDTYAYITGMLIGKHKLLENISPKKTWEGLFGGLIFGVLFSATYYHNVIDPELPIYILILITSFLSILGQFGDLVFSSIKRYFGKKDFSNIMPGHGGVLDRLDSIIFVSLGFMFFLTII